uniref:TPR_MLP1_2 domain-containing protein n=1 Tax=Steinernema glaseri TaxID=37863 RepID=A0A1I7ZK61_9BILA
MAEESSNGLQADDLLAMPKEQLVEGISAFWKQNKALEEKNKALQDEQAVLKKSLEHSTSTAALNMRMAEETEREFNEVKLKLEKTEADLSEKNSSLEKLQKMLEDLREEAEQSNAEAVRSAKEVDSLKAELKDSREYIKVLEAPCNVSIDTSDLDSQIAQLKEDKAQAIRTIAEKDEVIARLRRREEELTEDVKQSRDTLDSFQKEFSSTRAQLLEMQEHISVLEANSAPEAPEYKTKGCSIFAEFDDARLKQENDMRLMAQKNESLKRQLKDVSDECETLRCEVLNLRGMSTGKGDYDNEFVDKLCNENRECHDRISRLTGTVRKLENDLAKGCRAAPSLVSYKDTIQDLRAKNHQLQTERDRYFDENATLRNKCGAVESSLGKTEYELKLTQGRLDKVLAERNGQRQRPSVKVEQIIDESEIVQIPAGPARTDHHNNGLDVQNVGPHRKRRAMP